MFLRLRKISNELQGSNLLSPEIHWIEGQRLERVAQPRALTFKARAVLSNFGPRSG